MHIVSVLLYLCINYLSVYSYVHHLHGAVRLHGRCPGAHTENRSNTHDTTPITIFHQEQYQSHLTENSGLHGRDADNGRRPLKEPLQLEPVAELLGLNPPSKKDNIKKSLIRTKLAWAEWEIRRFGYKLGTANRQLRKLSGRYRELRNSFTASKEELSAISASKREVSVKLRIAARLRRLFSTYRNGLLSGSQPKVPYVPLCFRSKDVPTEFYNLGNRKPDRSLTKRDLSPRTVRESKDTSGESIPNNQTNTNQLKRTDLPQPGNNSDLSGSTTKVAPIPGASGLQPEKKTLKSRSTGTSASDRSIVLGGTQTSPKQIERDILGLIAEAKHQAVTKKGFVNNPTVSRIQSKRRGHFRRHIPRGL
ncbi:uncharacterized protein BBOV_IV011780 [Babesia bovis T2Bo]|uniref:Uncharacterized protein n=1 Tax=Babesia bovis TaxID=5865 RepID=A7ASL1_BABBO|nr:uncharacterized protein BBOV_IV011780 [Babesia bovis T2Bo]EDO07530.1 hypothetical protein BBOV_IV011780 [Babesia bovis T2Bo]|eukprot:XP_001611098.1 hypothetical protein [Babesia bovis T2Bo]